MTADLTTIVPMTKPGRALKDALLAHRRLRTYMVRHGRKQVEGGLLKRSPMRSIYLLLLRSEEHFYIKEQSLGIDAWVLEDAIESGAESVVIAYEGRTGCTVYSATIAIWRERAFKIAYADFDVQVQLAVRHMKVVEADAKGMPL